MLHLLNSPTTVNLEQVKHQHLMINKALKTLYLNLKQRSIISIKMSIGRAIIIVLLHTYLPNANYLVNNSIIINLDIITVSIRPCNTKGTLIIS